MARGGWVAGRAGVGQVSLYCVGVLSQAWEDKIRSQESGELKVRMGLE